MKGDMKLSKLKSVGSKKVLRIILWGSLVFFVVKGIVSIVRPDQSKKVYSEAQELVKSLEEENSNEVNVTGFAEAFSKEYLTYSANKTEEYSSRILKYTSSDVATTISNRTVVDLSATDAIAIKVDKINSDTYNVDVQVKVMYVSLNKFEDKFVRVPIKLIDGRLIVDDVPLFIARPERPETATINTPDKDGVLVDSGISSGVEDMLKNFLKVYAEGSQGEISYYLYDSSDKLNGLAKTFNFKDISDLRVYKTNTNNSYNAEMTYLIEDNESHQGVRQRASVTVIQKDGKYYVKEFNTRGR